MMNKTIEGIFGDPTTQFNLCLHGKLNSVQNCTNGLFASLPLQTQQYLWSRIFDNASEIDIGNENKTENGKNENKYLLYAYGVLLVGIVISLAVVLQIRIRSFKKVLKRNTIIRVPEIEDENFHIEMQLLREDNSSKEENERSTLLQYEKETNTDDDTSTGYGSQSSILTEHCSWQNSCELISTNINNQVEKDLFKGNLTLPDETPHSSVIVKYEMKSETLDSFIAKEKVADNYDIVKTKITVLQSPTKNIDPMDCSTIVENINSNGVSVLEGTNLEIERLDWSRIFCFLIKQIDPKIYEIFFTNLLENAGARNVNNIIESVKRETNSVMSTLFALFQRWRYGVGSSAKPMDIEEVFETLEWNAQLKQFREFMRNPPYLRDNMSWTNFSIPRYPIETGQMFLQQPKLFHIKALDEGQSQIRDRSLLSENIEENVFVTNTNNHSVYESHRKIRRRRCHDDSEVCTKYMKLDDRSTHERVEKINRQHQNRNRGKGNFKSKCSKMVNDKTRVSLYKRNSFNAHCPQKLSSTELPSEIQISSSKPTELLSSSSSTELSYVSSSGYGSGSSTNYDLTSNFNVSNHTCDEGLPESISKPENCSEFLNKQLSFSENDNRQCHKQPRSVNKLTMKCKSTGKRWNVCPNPSSKRKQTRPKQDTGDRISLKRDGETLFKNRRNQKGCKQTEIFLDDAVTEAIIGDLLDRLTPKREDVLSLRFRAYRDADCLITSWNEKIFVIPSIRQSMLFRENEWNTIRNYVNKIRKLL